MSAVNMANRFHRSGLAAVTDLDNLSHKEIFSALEIDQCAFLDKESGFRSKEYKWPHDPLHCWSRVWEYPYVYYHLAYYLRKQSQVSEPLVVDFGSGVTFFPFSLAKLGYRVVCVDIDSICERDLSLARNLISHAPGTIDFKLIKGGCIPIEDSICDAIYCISVIEHIPDFEYTISEIARILKPGGLCLITCDISMRSSDSLQLDKNSYARFTSLINDTFVQVYPEHTIHPVNLLTTLNSPYPLAYTHPGIIRTSLNIIKQKILKPLLGRKPGNIITAPPLLSVLGLVLRKKHDVLFL